MRRSDRLALIGLALLGCSMLGCAAEVDKYEPRRSVRGTFGEEVYKALCRRVAGTELPQDLTGQLSYGLCLGDATQVQTAVDTGRGVLPPRLIALAERRAALAQALDDMFPEPLSDELEQLFRGLLPFYDPPEEQMQNATRELAKLLERIGSDPASLSGLARVLRQGMSTPEGSLGLLRGSLGAAHLREMAASVLTPAMDDPSVEPHYDTLLSGLALELATSELEDDEDTERTKQFLMRRDPAFASGKPLYISRRDARGLPVPTAGQGAVPFPFADANGDLLADADASRLVPAAGYTAPRMPEPFPTPGEVLGSVARDAHGRAYALLPGGASDPAQLMYESIDTDDSLLAGALRALQKFFQNERLTEQLGAALPAIVGDHAPTTRQYAAYAFQYAAPNPAASPLLDVVHGSTALIDRAVMDESLELTERLIRDHEPSFVQSLEPLLRLERLTRPGADQYEEAKLKPGNTFWDEALFEAEKISRRRLTQDGDTLLEAMLRASLGFGRNLAKPDAPIEQIVDPELLRHQGAVLATLMRFKDEWRSNPKGESERSSDEPLVLGGFRTPVDRTMPEAPVTCGRDGCGGPIDGTPFAVWKQPGQNCMVQFPRRSAEGRDCGAAANQSLLHRSLGLIAETAGRSQCNKALSIGDLLDAVLEDACAGISDAAECERRRAQQKVERQTSISEAERMVARDYVCPPPAEGETPATAPPCRAYQDLYPAAFIDRDATGPLPAAIQDCHLLDVPDVGRSFGDSLLGLFRLAIPNPWVRRYLEDVARAGDHEDADDLADLPSCSDTAAGPFINYPILDPSIAPNCTPEAARNSRDLYEQDLADKARLNTVDTLGELFEFLLDDSQLFTNEADTRDLRPDPKALSRALFAPPGSNRFVAFDIMLLRGAPPLCTSPTQQPVCTDAMPGPGCCINPNDPPFRYRLDTYYGATSFAWEHPIRLTNGKTISFLDTMKSMSDAVARYDFDARRGDDPNTVEDTSYVVSTLSKLVADHYDSERNPAAQAADPNGLHYRRLTGLVNYERLMADALDDGMIDLAQPGPDGKPLFSPGVSFSQDQQLGLLYHSLPAMAALDEVTINGRDGFDISAEVAEQLLSPHARCAGASGDRRVLGGTGACDRARQGMSGFEAPFLYRGGRDHICWNDGRCFNGQGQPHRYPSPLYVMLDALSAMDDKFSQDPVRDQALRGVASGVLDAYATTAGGRFTDRRLVALLLATLDESRDEVAREKQAGTLGTLAARTEEDMADLLHNPVIAGALGLFANLHGKGGALAALARFSAASLSESDGQNNLRPLLAGLYDIVQLTPGDAETNAALRAMGMMFATDVDAVLRGEPVTLAPQASTAGRNLFMMKETAVRDMAPASVLERLMANLARAPEGRPSPLEVILDTAIEINRAVPGAEHTPSPEDLRLTFKNIADVLRDPRRGFERLYTIVRCTNHGSSVPGCE